MLIFLTAIILIFLFYLGTWTGLKLSQKNPFVSNLGEQLYYKKIDQLKKSPIFKPLRNINSSKNYSISFLLIFTLISIKSIAFYFIGLILVVPLVLLVQGILMGCLFNYLQEFKGTSKHLKQITLLQLISHISLAAPGLIKGHQWLLLEEINFNATLEFNSNLIIALAISLIFALLATHNELQYVQDLLTKD